MADSVVLATLSSLSYARNPPEIAMKLIQYYNEANESQSSLFFGTVKALAPQVSAHQNDPDALAAAIRADLTAAFNVFFTDVNITTRSEFLNNGRYNLYINGSYTAKDGQRYTLDEKFNRSA